MKFEKAELEVVILNDVVVTSGECEDPSGMGFE